MIGKARRMSRILDTETGHTVIVPIDDSLISGPQTELLDLRTKIAQIAEGHPNAILGFPGHFEQHADLISELAWICNLTASTTRSCHTRKQQILSVKQAVALGVDCVAAHVNISSRYESEMLVTLGKIIEQARRYGFPVLAIMYPRSEHANGSDNNYEKLKHADLDEYTNLLSHCVRIAKDLGADIIKTQYTGSTATFDKVVTAAKPIPLVIAGGELKSAAAILAIAADCVAAGGAGVSFGRNIFARANSQEIIRALNNVVINQLPPSLIRDQINAD